MKLTIKELAPYLPYKPKVQIFDPGGDPPVNEIETLIGYDGEIVTDEDWADPSICKLILRPLSDLTKEIKHDRERFVPIVELAKIAYYKDIDHIQLKGDYVDLGHGYSFHCHFYEGKINFDARRLYNGHKWDYNCFVPNQLTLWKKLFEWKFNVFDLSNDLFINVNELSHNPYK